MGNNFKLSKYMFFESFEKYVLNRFRALEGPSCTTSDSREKVTLRNFKEIYKCFKNIINYSTNRFGTRFWANMPFLILFFVFVPAIFKPYVAFRVQMVFKIVLSGTFRVSINVFYSNPSFLIILENVGMLFFVGFWFGWFSAILDLDPEIQHQGNIQHVLVYEKVISSSTWPNNLKICFLSWII